MIVLSDFPSHGATGADRGSIAGVIRGRPRYNGSFSPPRFQQRSTRAMTSPLQPPSPSLRPGERQRWGQLHGSATSLTVARLAEQLDAPLLWVAQDSASARRIEEELRLFGDTLPVAQFPDWETLPYDSFSPHQDIVSERLTTLYRLPEFRRGVLVVPVSTLMQRIAPPSWLLGNVLLLEVGQRLDLDALRTRLHHSGYTAVNTVQEPGEYALRGALMDLFPTGSRLPYRIDLLDEEIDTLRTFDPETNGPSNQSVRCAPRRARNSPLAKRPIATSPTACPAPSATSAHGAA